MNSLNLNTNVLKRGKLYYDQYRYSVTGVVHYANAMRERTHEGIDKRIELRRGLERNWAGYGTRLYVNGIYLLAPRVTEEMREHLHEVLDLFNSINTEHKLVLNTHRFSYYTNDVNALHAIAQKLDVEVTEVLQSHDPDIIVQKNPQWKYRNYFRNATVTDAGKEAIVKFVQAQEGAGQLAPSPSLQAWMNPRQKSFLAHSSQMHLRSHFFVDYDDPKLMLMFELIAPGTLHHRFRILTEEEAQQKSSL